MFRPLGKYPLRLPPPPPLKGRRCHLHCRCAHPVCRCVPRVIFKLRVLRKVLLNRRRLRLRKRKSQRQPRQANIRPAPKRAKLRSLSRCSGLCVHQSVAAQPFIRRWRLLDTLAVSQFPRAPFRLLRKSIRPGLPHRLPGRVSLCRRKQRALILGRCNRSNGRHVLRYRPLRLPCRSRRHA
jgi:hypothetical protein